MSGLDAIFERAPVNGTAARVTSQSGEASDEITELDGLRAQARNIQERIQVERNAKQRKRLAQEFGVISKRLGELREVSKKLRRESNRNLSNYFVDVVKSEITRPEFDRYIRRARELMESDA